MKHISVYNKSELKAFKNMTCLGEISNNQRNNLLGTN